MKKVLFIYNPHAGTARLTGNLSVILKPFLEKGYEVTVRATAKSGDCTDWVAKYAAKFDRILVGGGDGTLNEAVNGVLKAKANGLAPCPIGYIPSGSTNDFANSLRISNQPARAAKIAADSKTMLCDGGMLNEKPFVYVAAFGLFSDVSYATPQGTKNAIGHAAYLLEGLKSLSHIDEVPLTVTVGTETIEDKFIMGMISNSTSIGGFDIIYKNRDVSFNDGLLEVLLVRAPKNAKERSELFGDIATLNLGSKHLFFTKAERVAIRSETPLAWSLDGEFGGEWTDSEISVLPHAYEIFVP